jgi:valyl-tRNA synthetase
MGLARKYHHQQVEEKLNALWAERGTYRFDAKSEREVYTIDTPPPTISGHLHMGHVYSYSHIDFVARFQRMAGKEVFYPMGFDDNGLPTELLVERELGQRAEALSAEEFKRHCLETGERVAAEYRAMWQALGLSVD